MRVSLMEEDWVKVLNNLALGQYVQVQPLITRISDQLIMQKNQTNNASQVEAEAVSGA